MRAILRGVFCMFFFISGTALAQDAVLKPFVLASKGPGEVAAKADEVKAALAKHGFTVAGS